MNLTYSLENASKIKDSNCIIQFFNQPNKILIGFVRFHIEYSQIIISLLFIYEEYRGKGFGTKVLDTFEKYISKKHKSIKDLVLIPEYFNGIEKNGLCLFYEKNGFIQESKGLPVYIKKLKT
jgi:GNAT superfamily N-acetyltransferase